MIFLIKCLFYCFAKAHKNFSRRHLAFKVAPMCAKAHIISTSVFEDHVILLKIPSQIPQSYTNTVYDCAKYMIPFELLLGLLC